MLAALAVYAFLQRSIAIPESKRQIHPLCFKKSSQFTTIGKFYGVKIQNDICSFASKACMCVYTCQWHSDTGSTIQFQCWKKLDEFVSYSQLSVPMATTQRCLIALEPGPLNYPWIKKNIMTTVRCVPVCVCARASYHIPLSVGRRSSGSSVFASMRVNVTSLRSATPTSMSSKIAASSPLKRAS